MVIISCVDIYCWQKSTKIVNWHASSIIPSENTNWSLDSLTSTKLTVDQYDFSKLYFCQRLQRRINDNTVYIKVSRFNSTARLTLTHREPYCFKFPFWVKIINRFLSTHLGGTAWILVNIMANYQLWPFQASEIIRKMCELGGLFSY